MSAKAYWGHAGPHTYYAAIAGHIRAILYWSDPVLGEEGGPGGEPVVVDARWCWIPGDSPDNHYEVDAPPLTPGMSEEELRAAHQAALDEAQRQIADYIEKRGRFA
jgi:hypothetical protein